MVDKAIYAEKAAREAAHARKVAPLAWVGFAVNVASIGLILNRFTVNIGTVGERSESFIATSVTMVALLIGVAMALGWIQWLRKKGTTDGMSVLWITTIILLIVAASPVLTPEFYLVSYNS
ncbi:MAG: hypothetical protein L0G23_04095 [Ruaniaceae bacterium]|nr:hypothetical protein [Ruaniaceae bacterium]